MTFFIQAKEETYNTISEFKTSQDLVNKSQPVRRATVDICCSLVIFRRVLFIQYQSLHVYV